MNDVCASRRVMEYGLVREMLIDNMFCVKHYP